jgi:hypothetical protein
MNIFQDEFIKKFNAFISQLKLIFSSDDTQQILTTFETMPPEVILENGIKFNSLFDNDDIFDQFIKSKIKVFSHKEQKTKDISESLFGINMPIKNLLNNQPDDVKKVIWTDLHTLFFFSETLKPIQNHNHKRISLLTNLLHANSTNNEEVKYPSKDDVSKKLNDMLGVQVNKETSDMIDEIVGSFEKIMNRSSKGNPIGSIMEISKIISVKYADKINNGEIEIDKLMSAISKKIPGMDKLMEQMMSSMKSDKKAPPKEKVVIDENFSTSQVDVGEVVESNGSSMNIGNILKMADQFGVIPGGKQSGANSTGSGMPDFASIFGSLGGAGGENINMEKIMGMMGRLNSTNTPEEAAELKKEMDEYMKNELGVNIDELNEQIKDMTNNITDAPHDAQHDMLHKEQEQQ